MTTTNTAAVVSIHTRHYWRVKPRTPAQFTLHARFNPHPPLLAGETQQILFDGALHRVSIHTRHYWRVKRGRPHALLAAADVSIHTRHYWRVKRGHPGCACRCGCVSIHTRHYWRVKRPAAPVATAVKGFNPHPPLLAGETGRLCRWSRRRKCFNPHPPLLAGETVIGTPNHFSQSVSIHTRHYWRVKQMLSGRCGVYNWFQSTPAITGG